ncbi:ATP-binding protein [Streptacidiphilus monticola]|jgi:anti-sigma regulatory factor (Ser/Thr protein kinase)|uniref:ATP-binding protein n=1 Tax=Streptacidiphilus monticola TaxID=2161674 RepID=A0ABW1G6U6_9ACTN
MTEISSAAAQRRRLTYFPESRQVARGRAFVREALTAGAPGGRPFAADPDEVDDVLLAASELLSNAIQHAGGVRELVVTLRDGLVRLDVLDASPVEPRLLAPGQPTRPGGHGLQVVNRLAARWGSDPVPGGKSVWAEFPLVTADAPGGG